MKSTTSVVAGQIVASLLQIVGVALLTRAVGVAGFGIIGVGLMVQAFAAQLASLGFQTSLLRVIPRGNALDRRAILFSSLVFAALASVILSGSAILWAAGPWSATNDPMSRCIEIMALSIPLLVLTNVLIAYLRGVGLVVPVVLAPVVEQFAFVVSIFVLMRHAPGRTIGWAAATYVGSAGAGLAAVIGIAIWSAPTWWPKQDDFRKGTHEGWWPTGPALREFMALSTTMQGTALMNVSRTWLPTMMLTMLGTSTMVGIFVASQKVVQGMPLLLFATSAVMAPLFSSSFAHGRLDDLRRLYSGVTHVLLGLLLPVILVGLTATGAIAEFVGIPRGTAELTIQALVLGQAVSVSLGPIGVLLNMTAHQKSALHTELMGIAGAGITAALLIPHFGAFGAAVGAMFGSMITNIVRVEIGRRALGVVPFLGRLTLAVIGLGAVATVIGRLAQAMLPAGTTADVTSAAILVTCYLAMAYLAKSYLLPDGLFAVGPTSGASTA